MNWLYGNFEDDDAADFVESLIARHFQELNRFARRRRLTGSQVIAFCMPRLAIVALLNRGVGNDVVPPLGQLLNWRERFLAAFDRDVERLYDEPAEARKSRRTFERTFQYLQSLIESTD